jgi:hypothetical protein
MTRHPWERRALAAVLCVTLGFGGMVAAVFAAAALTGGDQYDGPDLLWEILTVILTIALAVLGWFAIAAAGNYVANEAVSGRRVAQLAAATWLLFFVWGIPATGWLLSGALVIYTALVLPFVLVVLAVSWLARRGRA